MCVVRVYTCVCYMKYLTPISPSAKGIEVKFKNQTYPVLINPTNVAELTKVALTKGGVAFGASVTLSAVEETLRRQVNALPGKVKGGQFVSVQFVRF